MDPPKFWFTWKTKTLPENMASNLQAWKKMYPEGIFSLLDDSDLRNLWIAHFPQYKEYYDNLTSPIERVDMARLAMMLEGGTYADLDTIPVRRIDGFWRMKKPVIGCEPIEHAREMYGRERVLCNAFMTSDSSDTSKRFWRLLTDELVQRYEDHQSPVWTTGPMAWTRIYEEQPQLFQHVEIVGSCPFFSVTSKGQRSTECSIPEEIYVEHLWYNTWVKPWYQDPRFRNGRYWFYALMIIFLILVVWVWLVDK